MAAPRQPDHVWVNCDQERGIYIQMFTFMLEDVQ